MTTVTHYATLVYYDGPLLVEARDLVGGHYVAAAVEPAEGKDRFLVVGVEPERLRLFKTGALDLRSLITGRAATDWYIGEWSGAVGGSLLLSPQIGPVEHTADLPDPGFFLSDHAEDGRHTGR